MWREFERARETQLRLRGVEPERAFARESEESSRPLRKRSSFVVFSRSLEEFSRLQIVMREDFRKIFDPLSRLSLDPGRRSAMTPRAIGSRNLHVCDVANEDVPKRCFALAVHRRRPRRSHEFLLCELVQRDLEFVLALAGDIRRAREREDVANDGGIL